MWSLATTLRPQLRINPNSFYEENFSENKEKFKKNKDFFRLTGRQLIDFIKLSPGVTTENTTVLTLWTKRGAMIHAKMLTTPKAWQVFLDVLLESYFEKNEKSDWDRVNDLVTPQTLLQQRSIAHQKSNSNLINAENVYSEERPANGRAKAIAYNRRNCVALTDRMPASWREQGRQLGLPRPVICSAKAVARVVEPELACVRSMADQLILDGVDEQVAFEVARSCTHTFRLLARSGWRPRNWRQLL